MCILISSQLPHLHCLSEIDVYVDGVLWISISKDLVGEDVIPVQDVAEALFVRIDTMKPTVVDINDGQLAWRDITNSTQLLLQVGYTSTLWHPQLVL